MFSTNLPYQFPNQLTKLATCFWNTYLNRASKIVVMKISFVVVFQMCTANLRLLKHILTEEITLWRNHQLAFEDNYQSNLVISK